MTIFALKLCQCEVEYNIITDSHDDKDSSLCNNCLTLSQFVTNTSYYLTDNTTLTFHPGNFTLGLSLEVTDVQSFILRSNCSSDCVFTCNTTGKLLFHHVRAVHIDNMSFRYCFGNRIVQVKFLFLSNTSFTGETFSAKGTALEFIETTAVIIRCYFSKYYHGSYRTIVTNVPRNASFVHTTSKWIGAAMIISLSNITLVECNFTANRAQLGGAVYAENGSVITINKTAFIFNTAWEPTQGQTAAGGALYAVRNCWVTIHSSSFCKNKVYDGYTLGGAIAMYGSVLGVHRSIFTGNQADVGGSLYTFQSNASFELSKLNHSSSETIYGKGGFTFAVLSSLHFNNSTVTHNVAHDGGFAHMSNSNISMWFCTVASNIAFASGAGIFAQTSMISLNSCNFTKNSATFGAVITILNAGFKMKVIKSHFLSNQANNDGAVFYFHNFDSTNTQAAVFIRHSSFVNNKAQGNGGVLRSTTSSLHMLDQENTYESNSAQNGGVMYVRDGKIEMVNSSIFSNFAMKDGIIYLEQTEAQYHSTTCVGNYASAFVAIESQVSFFGEMKLVGNKELDSNRYAEYMKGGAITLVLGFLTFEDKSIITFSNNEAYNYGGAISSINSNIRNLGETKLLNNKATKGGGIYLFQSVLKCQNGLIFVENHANVSGGGIHSLNSFTRLVSEGYLLFMRNIAHLGGGLYLTSNSKINILGIPGLNTNTLRGLRIRLINNSASYGGGIYVDDNSNPLSCTASTLPLSGLENECFIQAKTWYVENIKYLFFNLNKAAVSGNDIYGGFFDRCKTLVTTHSYQTLTPQYLLDVSNIKEASLSVSSLPVRLCFCRFNKLDCSYQPPTITHVAKGEDFNLQIVAVDQVNNTLNATINAYPLSPESRLGAGQQSQHGFNTCTNVTYRIDSPRSFEKLILYSEGPCKNANSSTRYVDVLFLPCRCAIGFMDKRNPITCECICHDKLAPYVKCNSSTSVLVRNSHAWMSALLSHQNDSNEVIALGYVVYPYCPYDYCFMPNALVRVNLSTNSGTDAQCNFNRSGVLCGGCQLNLSLMLGSSRCQVCSNFWLGLLVPFCLAGVMVVVSILILNFTVSAGTICGFIFFSNIVIANRPLFIPLRKYNVLAMFVSWLSLDLGIETCFANGLTTYGKTWLQFVFPAYIFVLIVIIIVISHYSQRFSNLLGGRNPIATFATLIWLSNAKLIRTILTTISFTHLSYPNHTRALVWLPDANVNYLSGKHIPLFLFALLVLMSAIAYILLLLSWQWIISLPKFKFTFWSRNTKLIAFMDAHHAAFKGKHRYWLGLLLLISIVQYSISAFNVNGNPAANLYAIILLVTAVNIYRGVVQGVYNKPIHDCLESILHFNLIVFAVSTMYVLDTKGNQTLLMNISLSILFVMFVVIAGYHIMSLIFSKKLKMLSDRLHWRKLMSRYDDEFMEDLINKDEELLPMNNSRQETGSEKHPDVCYVETRTNRDHRGQLIRQGRIDIDRQQFRPECMVASRPAVTIFVT